LKFKLNPYVCQNMGIEDTLAVFNLRENFSDQETKVEEVVETGYIFKFGIQF
jgi:hypothetical protein